MTFDFLSNFRNKFLGFIFPLYCVQCKKRGSHICEICLRDIRLLCSQQCPSCRAASIDGKFCSNVCKEDLFGFSASFDNLIVCCEYKHGDSVSELVTRFKYSYSEEIAEVLGDFFAKQFRILNKFFVQDLECLGCDFVIVPVPLHKKREKERGFNQSLLLAKKLVDATSLMVPISNCIKRIRNTNKQAHLDRTGRLKNLSGAFCVNDGRDVRGKTVVLIDDVCTTCSTLNECAKQLKAAGARKVVGFVLARGRTR